MASTTNLTCCPPTSCLRGGRRSLAACGVAPTRPPARARRRRPRPAPSTKYYKDDGPGDSAPANLDAIPDAVPRLEPLHRFANRPYTVFGREYVPATTLRPYRERGVASWYGRKFHGEKTSTGETYDMYAMTAAHPTLPLPSYARVTNVATGKSVVVRVNDRGPFLHDRVIDLSFAAAERIGIAQKGSGEVEVEAILPGGTPALAAAAPLPPVAASHRDGAKGRPRPPGIGAGPGRGARGRIRRAARRVCKLCQCAEFRRASGEPTRPIGVEARVRQVGRPVPSVCRSLPDARRGEAHGRSPPRRVGTALDDRGPVTRSCHRRSLTSR